MSTFSACSFFFKIIHAKNDLHIERKRGSNRHCQLGLHPRASRAHQDRVFLRLHEIEHSRRDGDDIEGQDRGTRRENVECDRWPQFRGKCEAHRRKIRVSLYRPTRILAVQGPINK